MYVVLFGFFNVYLIKKIQRQTDAQNTAPVYTLTQQYNLTCTHLFFSYYWYLLPTQRSFKGGDGGNIMIRTVAKTKIDELEEDIK